MTFSHTSCTHPATSKDRAKCRKAQESGQLPANAKRMPTSRAKRNADRTATEAEAAAVAAEIIEKATKKARANAYRTAATQARNPLRATNAECFECGSKAGWIDTKNNEPVCIKHVDYDRCKILPL